MARSERYHGTSECKRSRSRIPIARGARGRIAPRVGRRFPGAQREPFEFEGRYAAPIRRTRAECGRATGRAIVLSGRCGAHRRDGAHERARLERCTRHRSRRGMAGVLACARCARDVGPRVGDQRPAYRRRAGSPVCRRTPVAGADTRVVAPRRPSRMATIGGPVQGTRRTPADVGFAAGRGRSAPGAGGISRGPGCVRTRACARSGGGHRVVWYRAVAGAGRLGRAGSSQPLRLELSKQLSLGRHRLRQRGGARGRRAGLRVPRDAGVAHHRPGSAAAGRRHPTRRRSRPIHPFRPTRWRSSPTLRARCTPRSHRPFHRRWRSRFAATWIGSSSECASG